MENGEAPSEQRAEVEHASNRTPRHINRNLLFKLVRKWQPLSRADLARRSGLRRSTVSIIIEELLKDQWLIESAVKTPTRGRRPVLLRFNESRAVIALDIHPSQTSVAIADMSGQAETQFVVPTALQGTDSLQVITDTLVELIRSRPDKSWIGVGVCLPGRVDAKLGTMVFAPRLSWPSMDVRASMQAATGLPAECDNVANACALAEVWFGDTDAKDGMVVVNVSEGIAVSLYLNGRLWRGHRGMAGEYGHVQMQSENGVPCACGNRGCWETLASETAALRYHVELAGEHAAPTYKLLIDLALGGQMSAVAAVVRAARELGRGIRMLLTGLAAGEIVIIGDISRAWQLVGEVIENEVRTGCKTPPQLVRCRVGDEDARIRGAIALILSHGSV